MEWVDGTPLYEQARLHPPAPERRAALAGPAGSGAGSPPCPGRGPPGPQGRQRPGAPLGRPGHAHGLRHRPLPGRRRPHSRHGLSGHPALPLSPVLALRDSTSTAAPPSATSPRAADDLYALGVTFCRLLTGEYPELSEPFRDEHGTWHLKGVRLPRALLRQPRRGPCAARPHPAPALGEPRAARHRGAAGAGVGSHPQALPAPALKDTTRPAQTRAPWRYARLGRRGGNGGIGLGRGGMVSPAEQAPRGARQARFRGGQARPDWGDPPRLGGRRRLPLVPRGGADRGRPARAIAGQARPDEKGRCPRKGLVSLNGGCWAETSPGSPRNARNLADRCSRASAMCRSSLPGASVPLPRIYARAREPLPGRGARLGGSGRRAALTSGQSNQAGAPSQVVHD